MKCWICRNEEATTREHFIKKSDLKDIFGTPTQASPHYLNAWRPSPQAGEKPLTVKRNEPVRTLRSEELTYDAKLCAKCNNQVTQPHDRAWERLSKFLRTRTPPIQPGSKIRLHKVFGNDPHESMVNVHLFFVKQFAGIITDEGIPIPLQDFSDAILFNKPHRNIFLVFFCRKVLANDQIVVSRSEVTAANVAGQSIVSAYDYQLGQITVRVVYSIDTDRRRDIAGAYHPSMGSKCIEIVSSDQASHVESSYDSNDRQVIGLLPTPRTIQANPPNP